MCGIVGYAGHRPGRELLLRGLERLEHRGYDSAGVVVVDQGGHAATRAVGNLARLRAAMAAQPDDELAQRATTGIGHTRWATHGAVTEANAHPLHDGDERFHIVMNGVIENHAELRAALERRGARFRSATDAEVIAHLLARAYDGDLARALAVAAAPLRGDYAIAACAVDEPGTIAATRRGCPLLVGIGDEEHFVASAAAAFASEAGWHIALEDGDVLRLRADAVDIWKADGSPVVRTAHPVDDLGEPDLAGFDSYTRKEIDEQPVAVAATLREPPLDPLPGAGRIAAVRIIGCGSSYYAGQLGAFLVEAWAGLPAEVVVASEWAHRDRPADPRELAVAMSQSGETADTLAAVRRLRGAGCAVVGLTNVPGSQITRETDACLFTRAGIEIGVAATKTFTSQVAALASLALSLAEATGRAGAETLRAELDRLPEQLDATLALAAPGVEAAVERWGECPYFMFLGRQAGYPVALEGALKLKELAYVPADAYPAGEMKHGPIAMLGPGTPVVAVATGGPSLPRLMTSLEEVRSRGSDVIAVATAGSSDVAARAELVLPVAPAHHLLQPILAAVPLQLLALRIAEQLGRDVDRPRNLAKTVTVA
jgi:glucosamine--fructose-6-phosphate aminotransferase (isomerizing)